MASHALLEYTAENRISILREYGQTPESVKRDVEAIRRWAEKQPHFPEIPERSIIERFLLLAKVSIERTKQKLDMYYTLRSALPEFYDTKANNVCLQEIMSKVYFFPLPKLTKDSYRVTFSKLRGSDIENVDAVAYITHALDIAEVRLREDYCLSDVHICDLENAKFRYLLHFSLAESKRAAFILEKIFTNRVHEVHVINAPDFFNSIMSFLKRVLSPKLLSRVHVHADVNSLYAMISRDVMPKDYGGQQKSLEELNEEWKNKLISYSEFLCGRQSVKVNESLRPKESKDFDLHGVQGNFKQLDID